MSNTSAGVLSHRSSVGTKKYPATDITPPISKARLRAV